MLVKLKGNNDSYREEGYTESIVGIPTELKRGIEMEEKKKSLELL